MRSPASPRRRSASPWPRWRRCSAGWPTAAARGRAVRRGGGLPALLAGLVAVVLGGGPLVAILAASAATGATTPLVSGTVRALWVRTDPAVRPTAYAWTPPDRDGLRGRADDRRCLTVLGYPAVAMGVAGVLAVVGAVGHRSSGRDARLGAGVGRRTGRSSRSPPRDAAGAGQRLGADARFRCLEVAVPAFADRAGTPGLTGLLLAALVARFGRRRALVRRPRCPASVAPPVPLGPARRDDRAGAAGPVSSPWALGALLFLGGTAIAPTLTVQSSLVGRSRRGTRRRRPSRGCRRSRSAPPRWARPSVAR